MNEAATSTNISSPIAAYLATVIEGEDIVMLPDPDRVGVKSVNVFVFKSFVSFLYTLKNQFFSLKLSSKRPNGDSIFTVNLRPHILQKH